MLAAGSGTRFGGGKLLADYLGSPLVTHAVETALGTSAETVTVVLGANAEAVEQVLPFRDVDRLRTVRCELWSTGLSASLKCGIAALPPECLGALILLGDMPNVDPVLGNRVLARLADGAPAVLPQYGQTPAHPVAVSAKLFGLLGDLQGDHGARAALKGVEGVVQLPTADPGSIQDVDTPRDLADLTRLSPG